MLALTVVVASVSTALVAGGREVAAAIGVEPDWVEADSDDGSTFASVAEEQLKHIAVRPKSMILIDVRHRESCSGSNALRMGADCPVCALRASSSARALCARGEHDDPAADPEGH